MTTMLRSNMLTETHEAIQKRIVKARELLKSNPEKATSRFNEVLAELEYRQSAVNEALNLSGQIEMRTPHDMHEQCCILYRKYLVTADKKFASYISADKGQDAEEARYALFDAISVFAGGFDYGDIELADKCFKNYLDAIISYFLFFREKYTGIKTRK